MRKTVRPPGPEDFMPEFAEGTATHFRMYESVSEGTPISPPFETAEKLASWLVDTGASSFGRFEGHIRRMDGNNKTRLGYYRR